MALDADPIGVTKTRATYEDQARARVEPFDAVELAALWIDPPAGS